MCKKSSAFKLKNLTKSRVYTFLNCGIYSVKDSQKLIYRNERIVKPRNYRVKDS